MKHTNITCDAMKCNHFQRHYADRSKLKNEYINLDIWIILKSHHKIDIQKFKLIATTANIDGQIFVRGSVAFKNIKNSIAFAKIFKTVKGYNKKHFAQIYTQIKNSKWLQKTENHSSTCDELKIDDTNDETELYLKLNKDNNEIKQSNVYVYGTRYYFWKFMKHHKHYIPAKKK
eukprot:485325_1